jgi:hypothetical protein
MADTEKKGWVPPYISFTTLTGLIERMHDEGGAPPQIDRSYLRSFSGGYQAQVLAALKSLGLIEENGRVTSDLTELVEAERREDRVPIFVTMLNTYYPEPVRLGTIKATQGMLEGAFKDYGISGDTLRKAIAFYLGAAKYAGVALSVNFRVPSVTPSDGRKPGPKKARERASARVNGEKSRIEDRTDRDTSEPEWLSDIDPAIRTWLQKIPAQGQEWSKADRTRWTGVLEAIFGGLYGEA